MLSLHRPSAELIRRELAAQARLDFTYSAVGATSSTPPTGYAVDHTRVRLGAGEGTFLAASRALCEWQQFRLGWIEATPTDTRIEPDAVIAVLARIIGLWWLNLARIVYVVDEPGPLRRFGFAYGTLPDHVEAGEERFLIEWDIDEGSVYYDILAFSRPRHLLTKLGYPLVRRMQHRFRRESAAAMQRYVQTNRGDELPATPSNQCKR